jgi:hypothetical protein
VTNYRELWEKIKRWPVPVLFLLLAITLVTCPAMAQSTDPNHPTPLPSGVISGVSDGNRHTYYYIFDAGPGTLHITVQGRARMFSMGVSADLFDNSNRSNNLRRVGAIGGTGSITTERGDLNLEERKTIYLVLTLTENVSDYGVQITGALGAGAVTPTPSPTATPVIGIPVGNPTPWSSLPSSMLKVDGSGRVEHSFYYVDAGPGDLIVDTVAVGGTSPTTVSVLIMDSPVHTVDTITARAAAGQQGYVHRVISLATRTRLQLMITTDANTAHYIVSLRGAVNR